MTETPLRDVLTRLMTEPDARAAFERDPSAYLSDHGHELPDELLAEAITNVAAGLPAETAEHLATFTVANSPIPPLDGPDVDAVDPLEGLHLLASTSPPAPPDDPDTTTSPADADEIDVDFGAGATSEPGNPADLAADPFERADHAPDDLDAPGPVPAGLVDTDGGPDPAGLVDTVGGLDPMDLLDAPEPDEIPLEAESVGDGPDPADLDGLD